MIAMKLHSNRADAFLFCWYLNRSHRFHLRFRLSSSCICVCLSANVLFEFAQLVFSYSFFSIHSVGTIALVARLVFIQVGRWHDIQPNENGKRRERVLIAMKITNIFSGSFVSIAVTSLCAFIHRISFSKSGCKKRVKRIHRIGRRKTLNFVVTAADFSSIDWKANVGMRQNAKMTQNSVWGSFLHIFVWFFFCLYLALPQSSTPFSVNAKSEDVFFAPFCAGTSIAQNSWDNCGRKSYLNFLSLRFLFWLFWKFVRNVRTLSHSEHFVSNNGTSTTNCVSANENKISLSFSLGECLCVCVCMCGKNKSVKV